MASEQILNSPGILEREIDQSQPSPTGPIGVPAGVIGTTNKGPAFVPVVVGNVGDFTNTFGALDIYKPGTYAANEWLNNRTALTYLRVLGAGSAAENASTGETLNAGLSVLPDVVTQIPGRHTGMVQFLTQQGNVSAQEIALPMFTDNTSFSGGTANVVRGVILLTTGSRMMVQSGNASSVGAFVGAGPNDLATVVNGEFKLIISSSNPFVTTDGNVGVAIYSASFDPSDQNYFGKVLNKDPKQFATRQHLLYADFAVDAEILSSSYAAILSGSSDVVNPVSNRTYMNAFGSFKSRYKTAKTSTFISQPFGTKEYDLFYFEAMDDGEYANTLTKITITNLQASLDPTNKYGSFTVQVRAFDDTDTNMNVLETYPGCTLDPQSDHYVGRLIGDRKVFFNFDVEDSEKRVVSTGKYANVSKYVRVQISEDVERAILPQTVLPFGFRGVELLKTNDALGDKPTAQPRLAGVLGTQNTITGSVLPPIPFRFKVTRGEVPTSQAFIGQPGATEVTNPNLCWGVKFERNDNPTNSNLSSEPNALIASYTKFLGFEQLDTVVTSSGADTFNNNKFTLARVALSNGAIADLTSSVTDHMREAAYIRSGTVNSTDYRILNNGEQSRLTFASLLQSGSAATFNQFSHYAKFSTFMHGGFDGVNFLDQDAIRMNDKISSFDALGGAEQNYVSPGLATNVGGVGQNNSTVASYKKAIDIMTDKMTVNVNVLTVPGIRDSFITDYASQKVKEYGLAFYVMDIPSYDDAQNRLYDSLVKPSVNRTANAFDTRAIDNNYIAAYFPDVSIDDTVNKRRVRVPASVAALGAIGFNDRVAYPWFAPAGFNRAALDDVKSVVVRLNTADRDRLSNSRINPIATFPRAGFVIYGQKTLQVAKTSLNRVNVRRLLLEVKRIVIAIANGIVFEQNTQDTRNLFVKSANEQLGLIQVQSGVDDFNVIMDTTNNSPEDAAANKLNGRIVIAPTHSVEMIGIDFIVTNSGVTFT
jgi:hypothetical protein